MSQPAQRRRGRLRGRGGSHRATTRRAANTDRLRQTRPKTRHLIAATHRLAWSHRRHSGPSTGLRTSAMDRAETTDRRTDRHEAVPGRWQIQPAS